MPPPCRSPRRCRSAPRCPGRSRSRSARPSCRRPQAESAALVVDDALDVGTHRRGRVVVGDVAAGDRERRNAVLADLGVADGAGSDLERRSAPRRSRRRGRRSVVSPVRSGISATGSASAAEVSVLLLVVAASGHAERERRHQQQHRSEACEWGLQGHVSPSWVGSLRWSGRLAEIPSREPSPTHFGPRRTLDHSSRDSGFRVDPAQQPRHRPMCHRSVLQSRLAGAAAPLRPVRPRSTADDSRRSIHGLRPPRAQPARRPRPDRSRRPPRADRAPRLPRRPGTASGPPTPPAAPSSRRAGARHARPASRRAQAIRRASTSRPTTSSR